MVEKSLPYVPIIDLSTVPLPLSNPGDAECALEPPELSDVLLEELDPNSEPPELSHCSSLSCIIPPPPPDYEYDEMGGLMEMFALQTDANLPLLSASRVDERRGELAVGCEEIFILPSPSSTPGVIEQVSRSSEVDIAGRVLTFRVVGKNDRLPRRAT